MLFFLLFLCFVPLRRLFYLSLLISRTLHSVGYIFPFLLCCSLDFFYELICKVSSDNDFSLLHFFFLGDAFGCHLSYITLPFSSNGKESACNAGDQGWIPGLGIASGEGSGNPLQYPCLENPMGRYLAGYSSWGCKELDMTERLTHTSCTMLKTSDHSSSGTLSTRYNPLNLITTFPV